MPVSRVRIEADGRDHQEVMDDLNHAFALIFESRLIPRDTEFVEEVVETHIRDDGAIEYRGRRVIRFYDGGPEEMAELPDITDPVKSLSFVVSGQTATASAPASQTIWNVASNAASSVSVTPNNSWAIYGSGGHAIPATFTVGQATSQFMQPFYFHGGAGHGG